MHGAETREREADTLPLPAQVPTQLALPSVRLPAKPATIPAYLTDPAVARRLFVLLPFAMIAGLVAYAALPVEPLPEALGAVAGALIVLTTLIRRTPTLPLASLLLAAWVGFCLLPLQACGSAPPC